MADRKDPNKDFADNAKKLMDDLIRESNELDYALRQGRVGDLIRKYNPRPRQEESDDSDDSESDDGGTDSDKDVEGEAG